MRTLLANKYVIALVCILVVGSAVFAIKIPRYYVDAGDAPDPEWGITFSKKYATELGLDWREAYIAMLDELNVTHIRIPVYWDDIEPDRNAINLNDYKFMLDEAEKREVHVILAVGERLPRWPECHAPAWVETVSAEEREQAFQEFMENMIEKE